MTTIELIGIFEIHMLLLSMLKSIEDECEVNEVQGDAFLLIKRRPMPTLKKLQNSRLKIYNAFRNHRSGCSTMRFVLWDLISIGNLILKFIAH